MLGPKHFQNRLSNKNIQWCWPIIKWGVNRISANKHTPQTHCHSKTHSSSILLSVILYKVFSRRASKYLCCAGHHVEVRVSPPGRFSLQVQGRNCVFKKLITHHVQDPKRSYKVVNVSKDISKMLYNNDSISVRMKQMICQIFKVTQCRTRLTRSGVKRLPRRKRMNQIIDSGQMKSRTDKCRGRSEGMLSRPSAAIISHIDMQRSKCTDSTFDCCFSHSVQFLNPSVTSDSRFMHY